jgi:hypothetical protein
MQHLSHQTIRGPVKVKRILHFLPRQCLKMTFCIAVVRQVWLEHCSQHLYAMKRETVLSRAASFSLKRQSAHFTMTLSIKQQLRSDNATLESAVYCEV